jgi:hypothetical protein
MSELDEILFAAQTIRIVQLQTTGVAEDMSQELWTQERKNCDEAWRKLNEAHRRLSVLMKTASWSVGQRF